MTTAAEKAPTIRAKLKEPDPEWVERCRARGWTKDRDSTELPAQMMELKHKLLNMAGFAVAMPFIEEDLHDILNRGKLYRGYNARSERGERSRCHRNSALAWESNRNTRTLCTGYALSKDGCWRQHSWVIITNTDQVIETTEPRVAYFGFPMTENEAADFYYENL